jgi:hypothetical protein
MQRTLALGALWTASAGAAVGLGFLAVSLVDASAAPGTTPAAASTTASGTSAVPTPTPTSATGEFATVAGTVYANCTSGTPVLAGVPAAGWWVDDSNEPGEIEFENGTQKLEVYVLCVGGGPQFSVEGPRAEDRSGGDDSPSPSSSSSSPATSSTAESTHGGGDDSSGRDGGGHGSDDSGGDDSGSGNSGSGHSGGDDSGGDDSSGRDGGGHGSDD